MESTHNDVNKDQHGAHNDVQLHPKVGDVEGKVGYHGAHKAEDSSQL